jgi:hypothetical protein
LKVSQTFEEEGDRGRGQGRLTNRKILPLSGKIFFITAESAEKKLYNKKKHLCVLRVLCGE